MVGPLISEPQRHRVDDLVQRSVAAGARVRDRRPCARRLHRAGSTSRPCWTRPIPRIRRTSTSSSGRCFRCWATGIVDDAVRIANATEYGLSGGIYTGDLALGLQRRRADCAAGPSR